jgi:hypothetical protein
MVKPVDKQISRKIGNRMLACNVMRPHRSFAAITFACRNPIMANNIEPKRPW